MLRFLSSPLGCYFAAAFGFAWLTWLPIVLGEEGLAVLPVHVPLSMAFLGTFTGPMLAAFLVSDRTERRDLVARMFRVRMGPWFYAASLLAAPVAVAAATAITVDEVIQASRWRLYAADFIPLLLLGSIAGPWGEEPGWRGFALPRMASPMGLLRASLVLGVVWALWHLPIVLFVPAFRGNMPLKDFIVAYAFSVCALSVFMTWLYYASGRSVFATIVAHAAWNASVGVQDRLAATGDRRPSLVLAALLLAITALIASRGFSCFRFPSTTR